MSAPSSPGDSASGTQGESPGESVAMMRAVCIVLVLAGGVMLAPLWVAVVLAAWFTSLARPLHRALCRRLPGRAWGASILIMLVLLSLMTPFVLVVVSLASQVRELLGHLASSKTAHDFLTGFVGEGGAGDGGMSWRDLDPRRLIAFAREHGQGGLSAIGLVTGALTEWLLALFVFVCAVYAFLVDGEDYYAWLADHSLISRGHFHRMANAFDETGHGLIVGTGLTALAQGAIGTIAYALLGVPQWLILGLLTACAALIPSFGTAIVWVPIAAGLALTGQVGSAVILAVVGVVIISSIDNVLRPWLSRYGKLELPSIVLLVSIFGGLAVAGAAGILLGPLLVRLAKEALLIAREDDLFPGRKRHRKGNQPSKTRPAFIPLESTSSRSGQPH